MVRRAKVQQSLQIPGLTSSYEDCWASAVAAVGILHTLIVSILGS